MVTIHEFPNQICSWLNMINIADNCREIETRVAAWLFSISLPMNWNQRHAVAAPMCHTKQPDTGSTHANAAHLVGFGLLLLLLLLLLVLFLVSGVTSFGPGSARLALPGLPRGVPSTFGVGLPRIGCVRVWIRVDLKQSEAGGRGRDSDHCRWCHCDKRKVANNKRGDKWQLGVIEESLQQNTIFTTKKTYIRPNLNW